MFPVEGVELPVDGCCVCVAGDDTAGGVEFELLVSVEDDVSPVPEGGSGEPGR